MVLQNASKPVNRRSSSGLCFFDLHRLCDAALVSGLVVFVAT